MQKKATMNDKNGKFNLYRFWRAIKTRKKKIYGEKNSNKISLEK